MKPESGLRFVDVLVIEEGAHAGTRPRVEVFSFKSRDLTLLDAKSLTAQVIADASEALRYYGETLNIRRQALNLLDTPVQVHRVRLIYEGGTLKPTNQASLNAAVKRAQERVQGVEVLVQ